MPGSNSSGSTTSYKNSRRKRKFPVPLEEPSAEFELNKAGELVPALSGQLDLEGFEEDEKDDDQLVENEDGSCTKGSQSRNKRKQTFERRNIKRVRDDVKLSEEAQNAQRAEMERRMRLQIEQQGHVQAAQPTLGDAEVTPDFFTPQSAAFSSYDDLTPLRVKDEDKLGGDLKKIEDPIIGKGDFLDAEALATPPLTVEEVKCSTALPAAAPTASDKLFKQQQQESFGLQSGTSEETAIVLLGDSDDEIDVSIDGNSADVEIMDPVIELSDDDSENAAGRDAEAAEDIQAEFCELRDADNLPDSDGRVCIRKGPTEAESFYLSPHIARVIKPHQVSGVRFLFDNLIESKSQFQNGIGFGCILAHSMGLGKSIQVIAFLDLIFRYCRPVAKSVLLIVPINTLQNWQTEFQLWLPSVLHTASQLPFSPSDSSTKPRENGHQQPLPHSGTVQPPSISATPSSKSTTLPHAVQSSPSLLSLINDSPSPPPPLPPQQSINPTKSEEKAEPLFPPPLPAPPPMSKKDGDVKEEEATKAAATVSLSTPKTEDARQSVPRLPVEPPPFRLHVIKDTTKSLDARYQVVHEWDRVGGVLLMGYEMFRLLTNPRRQQQAQSRGVNPSLHPAASAMGLSSGVFGIHPSAAGFGCYPGGIGSGGGGLPMSASANVLFPTPEGGCIVSTGYGGNSRRRKRTITIDIEKEEKEEHMLVDMRIALTDPGPQIVICDEGHRIKNSEASISRALKALRTRRRVVLTGYPLQNNLMEYWCMVDFVRPNYLGTKAEFTNMFQRPIENGQCVDSTPADRKLMQGRAHVLHELLSGFVQRRSHAVLKASLPPKREVVLMVRMSPLQQRLYSALMHYIVRASASSSSGIVGPPSANTLQTYALCCKIWNHPDILWRVLKENVDDQMDFELDEASNSTNSSKRRQNGSNASQACSMTSLASGSASSTAGAGGGGTAALVGDEKYAWVSPDLWGADFRPGDVRNSGKLAIFLSLLCESVRAGDKMLLFSQSLLTLDLIERLLGQTPIDSEQPPSPDTLAEKAMAEANAGGDEEEETEKSLHYRISRRLGPDAANRPQVWIRNVHYFRLDGSTSATDRDRLIKRFNDKANPVKLFLVSTRAGSLGVNLIGANRVVVFDASWNPCHDCQAVCRVYRYGQEKPCFIYRLVSDNTMERKIYDRQVNKQGVSDRVVDEMNPGQQFTRAQVGVLMSFEDKDVQSITDDDMGAISILTDEDPVLSATLGRHREWITMKPFTHESLLIDRKDYRLTRVEKRIARQRYEQERLLNNSNSLYRSSAAATAFQYQQYMSMMMQSGAGAAEAFYNPQGNMTLSGISMSSGHRGVPNILSKGGSGAHLMFPTGGGPFLPTLMDDAALRRHEGMQRSRMLQKDLDEARIRALAREIGITLPNGALGSEYTITRVAATTDLVFPQSTNPPAPARSIAKGEVVEIIHTGPHGKYLRLPRTGDIYVVKPGGAASMDESADDGGAGCRNNEGGVPDAAAAATTDSLHPPLPNSSPVCMRCRQTTAPTNNCICSLPSSTTTTTPAPPSSSANNNSAASYHPPTYINPYGAVVPSQPVNYGNIAAAAAAAASSPANVSQAPASSQGYQSYN